MNIYGIFGFPLKHTLSPVMQEAAFKYSGIDAVYLPLEIDPPHFKRLARELVKSDLAGFNLTVPHKETILPYLDKIMPDAALIGAVNTVRRVGKKFWGYNTDWPAFIRTLKESRYQVKGKHAVLLGAGGAARACVYGLLRENAGAITVFNRHPE
jgi:shikimate dehydrogenase